MVFLAIIALSLSSCADLKGYRVGDNVEQEWSLANIDAAKTYFNNIAQFLCFCNRSMRDIAVGYSVSRQSINIENDRALAEILQNSLYSACNLKTYIVNTYLYLDEKDYHRFVKKLPKRVKFLVYTIYQYKNRGYNLETDIIDLKSYTAIKTFNARLDIKNTNFDIKPLEISDWVNIK